MRRTSASARIGLAAVLGGVLLTTGVVAAPAAGAVPAAGPPAVSAPGPARAGTPAASPASGIPRLTDEHGRALTLRGWNVEDKANRGDAALSAITEKHFRDMSRQGFNFARLLVFWDDIEPRRGQYSKPYLRKVERILGWAHKYGVRVLIDGHQDVFGPAFGHRGVPEWATRTDGLPFTPNPDDWFSEYFQPAVQRAFTHLYEDADLRRAQADLWKLLADRFGDHPAVLGYDFLNEPMGELKEGEDLPTAARRIERDQVTPMYNRLTAAVRSQDRHTWLFVEPTPIVGEGVPTGLGEVKDPQRKVVYAPHFYNTAMEAGADYDPAAGWIEAYEAAVTAYPRQYKVPVVVGEWGPLNNDGPNMARFYEDALASFARYSSGWAGYVWCYGGGYCAVDGAGRLRGHKARTSEPYAAAVAGRTVSSTYDAAAGRYTLTYEAGRGAAGTVSEVSLPPSATGWRVSVRGAAWSGTRWVGPGRAERVRVWALPGTTPTLTAHR
ncbi:cellulase family glycosylhydrolase [Streptomyces sp. NPDC004111]|uniref:cellulase family glycosylhydrolase n=1 Tax=Streptomyces sp. NPDC004111 TaxID=3364690 RepID=UPI0036C6BF04